LTVDLLLRVSRDADNRLSGTVAIDGAGEARAFSGTLELMSVFEELVPVDPAGGGHTGLAANASVPTGD
jgi:hypothetical protein